MTFVGFVGCSYRYPFLGNKATSSFFREGEAGTPTSKYGERLVSTVKNDATFIIVYHAESQWSVACIESDYSKISATEMSLYLKSKNSSASEDWADGEDSTTE